MQKLCPQLLGRQRVLSYLPSCEPLPPLRPDSKIELTPLGELQGAAAGQQIRTLVGNGTVRFFYSPYMRTRQTLQEILKAFKVRIGFSMLVSMLL